MRTLLILSILILAGCGAAKPQATLREGAAGVGYNHLRPNEYYELRHCDIAYEDQLIAHAWSMELQDYDTIGWAIYKFRSPYVAVGVDVFLRNPDAPGQKYYVAYFSKWQQTWVLRGPYTTDASVVIHSMDDPEPGWQVAWFAVVVGGHDDATIEHFEVLTIDS